jgi:hypothetical protein
MMDAAQTAISTLAEVAAALAALIGFFGLWRLDRLRGKQDEVERNLRFLVWRADGSLAEGLPPTYTAR